MKTMHGNSFKTRDNLIDRIEEILDEYHEIEQKIFSMEFMNSFK